MYKIISIFIVICLVLLAPGCAGAKTPETGRDTIMQVSTLDALMAGSYDGVIEAGKLKQYGDFGLGTVDKLNGEMIEVEGSIYQIKYDGSVNEVPDSVTIPFAAVTYFDSDSSEKLSSGLTMADVLQYLDGKIPTVNIFYAIKIEGTFSYMKTRSVPAQTKPYPVLTEVTKNQSVFEFKEVSGTVVGFRCPPYVQGVNMPGYHMHFLNDQKDAGGHILDFKVESATVYIDNTPDFLMQLPGHNSDFYKLDLTIDTQDALQKAEK